MKNTESKNTLNKKVVTEREEKKIKLEKKKDILKGIREDVVSRK